MYIIVWVDAPLHILGPECLTLGSHSIFSHTSASPQHWSTVGGSTEKGEIDLDAFTVDVFKNKKSYLSINMFF
jgi:hypothetical protein